MPGSAPVPVVKWNRGHVCVYSCAAGAAVTKVKEKEMIVKYIYSERERESVNGRDFVVELFSYQLIVISCSKPLQYWDTFLPVF